MFDSAYVRLGKTGVGLRNSKPVEVILSEMSTV